MTPQDNIAKVQAMYAAFGSGDIANIVAGVTEDIEWHVLGPNTIPYAHPYHGKAGVQEFFEVIGAAVEFETFEPTEFIASGDQVAVVGSSRERVRATGKSADNHWCMVFDFRDGLACRFRSYEDSAALQASFS